MSTPRKRFRQTVGFQRPQDRPFIFNFPIRPGTIAEWLKQGHPENVRTEELLGYDWFERIPLVTAHYPAFEKVIVEEKEGHVTYYDEEGALRTDGIADQGSGFVTRSWLKFPVESREDFVKMKERYNPEDMGRRRDDFEQAIRESHTCERPVMVVIQGFYWSMRQWLGFEGLSVAFYDMPEIIDEMLDFILDFNIRLLRAHLSDATIDMLMINEDMAYKTASMVSPAMFKDKFVPRYRELLHEVRKLDVHKVFVDCDGHIGELIPLWIEAGIDGTSPVEIAAEQDILAYAEKYPDFLFMGGIDKRRLSKDRKEVKEEVIPKATELYDRGGWIPCVDHGVPPDARFDNFRYMIELLKEAW